MTEDDDLPLEEDPLLASLINGWAPPDSSAYQQSPGVITFGVVDQLLDALGVGARRVPPNDPIYSRRPSVFVSKAARRDFLAPPADG